jgi:hypothetical protein
MPLDGFISVSPSWNHAAEEDTLALKGTMKWAFMIQKFNPRSQWVARNGHRRDPWPPPRVFAVIALGAGWFYASLNESTINWTFFRH